jgi:Putative peptidoglycan binding domain
MRILIVSLTSLALVTVVQGATKDENKSHQKNHAQTAQHAQQAAGPAKGASNAGKKTSTAPTESRKAQTSRPSVEGRNGNQGSNRNKGQTSVGTNEERKDREGQTSTTAYEGEKGKKGQGQTERQTGKAARSDEITRAGKSTEATKATGAKTAAKDKTASGKPFEPQHFDVAKQPNTSKAPPVKFQQGKQIQGGQNWHGQQYAVFRNYKEEWHDKNWWHNHHNRIVFVFGAPYYWDAGYWFPAWGYYPNAYYAWSGPIYAYNSLPPDQVIANVQATLQQQGYYHGEVDGLIGPLTRGAIADYQRDHGLYITSAIDRPTLESLGMA